MAKPRGPALQFELDDEDLKLFCEEADEQLELLDSSLVRLEGETDADLLQTIFRAAHTLKGSSATIGHKKMASLTHAMETVLDAVRQGRREPTSEVVDALLAALDALRVLKQEVVTRIDSGTETAGLEADLHAVLAAAPTPATPVAVAPPTETDGLPLPLESNALQALTAAVNEGKSAFIVEVIVDAGCQLPAIRCFQAVQELEMVATIHGTLPERAVIDGGAAEFSVLAAITTSATEEQIRAAVLAISDTAANVRGFGTSAGSAAGVVPAAERGDRPRLAVVEDQPPADDGKRAATGARGSSQSVRIDVERLDGLMNLVGELVIDRTRLQQIREQLASVLKDANLTGLSENFEETTAHLARITDELQDEIMRSRMLPVRSVLTRLPRLVRDVASKCGKKVELVTAGEETELDRSVIEEISDPLVHILRNAIDHGIETPEERRAAGKPETGTVWVTAWNQETYIYLSVRDDGKGIDHRVLRRIAVEKGLVTPEAAEAANDQDALNFIFYAGLSTAKTISDVSGRGVGMDIVRTNIERLNGQVKVKTEPGKGSEFIIQLPLTLATTKALMVTANSTVYALPLVSVTEALSEQDADIHSAAGSRTLRLRGKLLPIVDLAAALGDRRPRQAVGGRFVVAARHSDSEVAFLVDRLLGEQDVVVKSLGNIIGNHKGLTGATILGDGTLGLIIDMASLVSDRSRHLAVA